MRSIYQIIFLCWFLPHVIYSQTVNDMSKIIIGVKFQDGISQETEHLKPQLEDKLVHFATRAGCSSFDNNAFFISPNIVINSVDVAEGGMKNVYIVKGDLYLSVQDKNSGTIFSSTTFPFKGTATNKETAIKNGIIAIKYDNVESVFAEAKSKILAYYQSRKDIIFARANTCVVDGDYDGAIACLMMIPEDLTDLYEQALLHAQYIYGLRDEANRKQRIEEQKSYNDSILTIANSYLAMHQADAALSVLSTYAPGDAEQNAIYRKYVNRAEDIISAGEREVKRKEEIAYQDERRREERAYRELAKQSAHQRNMDRQEMALRRQVVSASERIERQRLKISEQKIRALKQVACEYIKNNPNRIDYIRVKF